MIYQNTVLDEQTGNKVFKEFTGTDKHYAALFEAFVLNFTRKMLVKNTELKEVKL